jgi:phosphoglycolate phosphatase-like HAD superfamily hydrolase
MAVQARREFRDIHPDKCLMIGNNVSDMQFGRNAGMYTVFLTTTNKDISLPHPDIDMIFEDLAQFVKAL